MPGRCLRCKEYVHAAEEKLALEGSSCHFECFTCAICNKALDSRTMCESTKAQEIYCRFCYKRYYCIPGYGFGPTKPALISVHPIRNKDEDELMDNDQDCCNSGKCATTPERIFVPRPPSRQGQAYARPIPVPHRQYSKQVPTPKRASDCGKLKQGRVSPTSRVSTYCLYHRGKIGFDIVPEAPQCQPASMRCNPRPRPAAATVPPAPPKESNQRLTSPKASARNVRTCQKCGKEVFFAELVMGYRGVYHRRCFACHSCRKILDSATVNEHQGQLYCKGCYKHHHGPAGVWVWDRSSH